MDDYIKREDILSDIAELKKSPWYAQTNGHADRAESVDIVTKLCVEAQPKADVVEVVRCEDCVHGTEYNNPFAREPLRWCERLHRGVRFRFFCADGERKEHDREN